MLSTDTSTATGVLTSSTQTIVLGFYFIANTDLVVTRTRAGVITTLTLDSDYSIAGAGNESGGSITVTGQASGDVITIVRTVPYTQLVDLVPLTKLSETLLEQALDKSTMMAQQLRRDLDVLSSATIEEAPIDGTSYARKDATWVSLAGGGDMLKSVYDTDNDGKVDSAETADTATTAGTISGSITMSQVSDAGSAATKAVGTTTGTVAAGDDSRIVAGGTAVQPSAIVDQTFAAAVSTNPYSATPALTPRRIGDRAYNTTSLEWWDGIATAGATTSWQLAASGGGGSGDMTKAVYDTVNRGYVDRAVLADTATTAGTISGSITISQVTNLSSELSAKLDSTTAASTYLTIATASTTYQPLDGDLTAIAALTGAGYSYRYTDGTWALLTGSSSVSWGAITGTLANQTDLQNALNAKQPLDADLTALAALTGEGYAHRATDGSWTLAAGSSGISWGSITGTLSSQTDLQTALNAKANTADLGTAALLDVGATSGTVCAGDDSRLSDARTPTAHASTHGSAGSDPITITISQVTNLSSELSAKLDSTTAASTYLTIATASTTYQPLDGDLTAIAGLSGTAGILTKTAANTWTLDTSTYLTTSVAASTYQPLDADLTAISGLTGNTGILTKTEANTWSLDTNTYLTTTAAAATYQLLDADLTAIAGLSGTAGLLRKTAADTWSLDTNVYLTGNETITLSGDATGSGTTAITVTLANTGVSAGSYGSATAVPAITFDAKGRTTQATSTPIQIAQSQVTDLGTALSAKSPVDNPTFTTGITTPAANITGLTASRALVSDASKNVTASSVTSTELGYVSGVTSALQTQIDAKSPSITPINAQTGTTYTLVASDAGKIVTCTNASAITVTVPASTFSAGQSVIIGRGGAGQVTLAAGSGMTLHTTTTLKAKAQYARIAVMFDSASEGTVIGERAAS